jgi:hypothetical protein
MAGAIAKTKVSLNAGGAALPLPGPFSASAYFDQDPKVLVQLINSAGACWESEFTAADTSGTSATGFRASAR